jgi:tRNA-Thr(GGU) m(6)t(6)A37 methyltransferase TsaA
MFLKPIGRIRTPYGSLAECPGSAAEAVGTSTIEIYPSYAEALDGIEATTHLILMYWLGQADRTRLRSATRVDGRVRGAFANRAPARPNPIGISAVRFLSRAGATLVVSGLDCLDQTTLLDIKPYIPALDCIDGATVDWMKPSALRETSTRQEMPPALR